MASADFINECKKYANCNRLGTIEITSSSTELTQDDKIQEFTIDSGCYVDGNIIGNVYVKKLETKLVNALNNTLENEEVDAQVGVKFNDSSSQQTEITYTVTTEPVAGTKYIITNNRTTPSHSVNSSAGDTLLSSSVAPTDNAWYVTPVEGGYTIQNVVTNKYLGITPTYTSGYVTNVTLSINDEPTVWVYNTTNYRLTYSTTGMFSRTYNFRYNNGWQTNVNSGSVYFASYNEPLEDEYIDLGKYIVEKPTDEILENLTSFVAYEGLLDHIDEVYTTELDYENETITIADVYEELADTLGLTPITTTFTNSTITVANNPFTNGEKNRDVLSSILKVSGSFLKVDNVNQTIDLVWLSNSLDYTFTTDDYATLEGGKIVYGPINTLIIKNSQIDDENVSRSDAESIAEYGEHKLIISEDYFLYDATLREAAIDDIWDKVKGTTYTECKLTSYTGKPFLNIGDKIRVYTDDENYFDTYVLKHQFTFDGSFKSVIESPCLTDQEVKTKQDVSLGEKLRNTQIIVNKQEGEINAIVENVDTSLENQQALISGLQITTNGISESVTSLQGITQEQYQTLSRDFNKYQEDVTGALSDIDGKFDGYVTTDTYGTFVQNVETSIGDTYTKTEINTKLSDGSVTKIHTTALTADENGLTVEQTNAPTKTNLNSDGLKIIDRNNNPVLKAVYDEDINNTVVETHRHQVQEYFIMGNHSRFENYGDGTGCFYIN